MPRAEVATLRGAPRAVRAAGQPRRRPAEPGGDQRARILEVALQLMGRQGFHATGMRQLAAACTLNPATLYHYFPSKADLLSAVIDSRGYPELLRSTPPVDPMLSVGERLRALLDWVWAQMSEHADMWRLLLGESLRGDPTVLAAAGTLTADFERALAGWVRNLLPELGDHPQVTARVLRGLLHGFFVEYLPFSDEQRAQLLQRRAADIARTLGGG